MALKKQSKIRAEFSMASMTDIIFLLLIFFLITSTVVSPNAIKLVLPKATNQTLAKRTAIVSINEELIYHLNGEPINPDQLIYSLEKIVNGKEDPTIKLEADKSVPVEHIVRIMSIGNKLQVKVILATQAE